VLTDAAAPYRERKVRLLNGAHTISVPLALLAGCETVREAVEHPLVGRFVRRALFDELVPGLGAPGAEAFARDVLDRFANPFVRHALVDITLHGTTKMRVRVVPSVLGYAERTGRVPSTLALGFAAYLLYMRAELQAGRRAAGLPVPADEQGHRVRAHWDLAPAGGVAAVADAACGDVALWGADLGAVPGFRDAVAEHLARLSERGAAAAIEAHLAEAPSAGAPVATGVA
jgi:tagaturonate reductase